MTELEQAAEAPEPKTPGVTVRIEELQPGFWTWNLRLDSIPAGEFYAYVAGPRAHEHQFPTPEAAEADCRKHLRELVERLFPGGVTLASTHGFSMILQNLTFVRE